MNDFLQIIKTFAKKNNIEIKVDNVKSIVSYLIEKDQLLKFLSFLQTHPELRFTILTDLFASDFPGREKRFEVVYSLLSLKINKRIIFKIRLEENEKIESITSIYSAASWYEREAFDMFGIIFNHSPDPRRILTDYGFKGHPLRKDFPLTGYLEVKYDDKLQKVIYEPVVLDQEFRNFDFASPWQGPSGYQLPGDEKATK